MSSLTTPFQLYASDVRELVVHTGTCCSYVLTGDQPQPPAIYGRFRMQESSMEAPSQFSGCGIENVIN